MSIYPANLHVYLWSTANLTTRIYTNVLGHWDIGDNCSYKLRMTFSVIRVYVSVVDLTAHSDLRCVTVIRVKYLYLFPSPVCI